MTLYVDFARRQEARILISSIKRENQIKNHKMLKQFKFSRKTHKKCVISKMPKYMQDYCDDVKSSDFHFIYAIRFLFYFLQTLSSKVVDETEEKIYFVTHVLNKILRTSRIKMKKLLFL